MPLGVMLAKTVFFGRDRTVKVVCLIKAADTRWDLL